MNPDRKQGYEERLLIVQLLLEKLKRYQKTDSIKVKQALIAELETLLESTKQDLEERLYQ